MQQRLFPGCGIVDEQQNLADSQLCVQRAYYCIEAALSYRHSILQDVLYIHNVVVLTLFLNIYQFVFDSMFVYECFKKKEKVIIVFEHMCTMFVYIMYVLFYVCICTDFGDLKSACLHGKS